MDRLVKEYALYSNLPLGIAAVVSFALAISLQFKDVKWEFRAWMWSYFGLILASTILSILFHRSASKAGLYKLIDLFLTVVTAGVTIAFFLYSAVEDGDTVASPLFWLTILFAFVLVGFYFRCMYKKTRTKYLEMVHCPSHTYTGLTIIFTALYAFQVASGPDGAVSLKPQT